MFDPKDFFRELYETDSVQFRLLILSTIYVSVCHCYLGQIMTYPVKLTVLYTCVPILCQSNQFTQKGHLYYYWLYTKIVVIPRRALQYSDKY